MAQIPIKTAVAGALAALGGAVALPSITHFGEAERIDRVAATLESEARATLEESADTLRAQAALSLALALLGAVGALVLARRLYLDPLRRLRADAQALMEGRARPAGPAPNGESVKALAAALDAFADANASVRSLHGALDGAAAALVVIDAEGRVAFANKSFLALAPKIAPLAPGLDVRNPVGKPAGALRDAHRRSDADGVLEAAGARVSVRAWPLPGLPGAVALEWIDRTDDLAAAEDFRAFAQALEGGDFSARLQAQSRQGALRQASEALNALADALESGMDEANRVLPALARGDVTARFHGDRRGIFGSLQQSANALAETLAGIGERVSASADHVLSATREIAVGAADLSKRTEEQATALQHTASSMEELATTVGHTADNARDAAKLASDAEADAEKGGRVVSDAVSAMARIEQSSRRITEIVGLIEEIAFQTNLLALNAAVEAARAGEAGRGFAVVASEVRALAQRAGQASREIKDLIVTSDGEVREGVALVREAGQSLAGIVGSVRRASRVIAHISDAAQEQAQGVTQINKAVADLDQITQQNAALVEQTSAALESTREQVEALASLIQFFQSAPARSPVQSATPPAVGVAPQSPARALQAQARARISSLAAAPKDDPDDWSEF